MGYSESNDQVILTMSRADWDRLWTLICIGADEMGGVDATSEQLTNEFLNRLNEGNPNYIPYQVEKPR